MKKTLWISVAIAALLASPACKKEPAGEAQAQQQLAEAQKKLEEAEQQAAEARRQLEEAQQKAAQAEQQRQLEEAQKKLEQAQKQAADARRQLDQARKSTAPAGAQSAAQPASGAASPSAASPAATSVAPAPPAPRPVTVPAGTQIVIRTTTALSTKDMKTGEHFTATLQQPLVVDGVTLAPKGAEVEGIVVESDPGGRVKGVAQIGVALRSIHTAAGKVEIQTGTYVTEAKSSVKKDVTRGAIMTGVGAAIGAIAGGGKGAAVGAGVGAGAGTATAVATRGEPAAIPAESVLTFQLKAPVTVTVK